jgi:hypothetical protein
MSEQQFDETYVRRELQERFRKVFGRDMNRAERQAFFLPCDSYEERVGDGSQENLIASRDGDPPRGYCRERTADARL